MQFTNSFFSIRMTTLKIIYYVPSTPSRPLALKGDNASSISKIRNTVRPFNLEGPF